MQAVTNKGEARGREVEAATPPDNGWTELTQVRGYLTRFSGMVRTGMPALLNIFEVVAGGNGMRRHRKCRFRKE